MRATRHRWKIVGKFVATFVRNRFSTLEIASAKLLAAVAVRNSQDGMRRLTGLEPHETDRRRSDKAVAWIIVASIGSRLFLQAKFEEDGILGSLNLARMESCFVRTVTGCCFECGFVVIHLIRTNALDFVSHFLPASSHSYQSSP